VIRQAISCDICATEKKQTNHWFVAYEQGGELRVSGWQSRNRLRPGSKHLCGQTCLHKLVDEFMAKAIAFKPQKGSASFIEAHDEAEGTDASLTSSAAYIESSARLISPPARPVEPTPFKTTAELVTIQPRPDTSGGFTPDEPPRYASRNWRAEAWERERERELRAVERRPDIARRRSNA
jgi:hypothetical protein